YAKIPYVNAVLLGVDKIRKRTVNEDVIINEGDLLTYGRNDDFKDKVKQLGGTVLTALEAKIELEKTL
ncbi:MAG: hypothetical protein ACI3ZP_02035, partial [Candidatus Cryptobacteroides sp.]